MSLILVSGISLALPFVRPWLGWYSLICTMPFLFLLRKMKLDKLTNKKTIKYIWLVGMVAMAIVVSWMFQLNTTGLLEDKVTRFIFLPFTLVFMVFIFSSGYAIFGWLYTRLKVDLDRISAFILLPAIWVVSEFLRSVIFSICMLGEGGAVGMHWNFGALGLGAVSTPLVFASRLVGMFGLSFLVVIINLCIFQLIRRKFVLVSIALLTSAATLSLSGWLLYRNAGVSNADVGIVHLGAEDDWDYEAKLQSKIDSENIGKNGLVIFPEYSHLFENQGLEKADKNLVNSMLQNVGGRIITTKSVDTEKGETNAVVLLDKDNNELSRQGKTFLIPGGEYIPYTYKAILFASGNLDLIHNHEDKYTVYQSKTPIEPLNVNGGKYGVLACSGIIAPEFYRDLVGRGAEVLVNSASLSTMGMGQEFFYQADQMAKFQAIANNRYLIQSARGKKSYVMTNNGLVIAKNDTENTNYFIGNVEFIKNKTIYTALGEWIVYISFIGLGAYLIYLNRRSVGSKRKRKNKK